MPQPPKKPLGLNKADQRKAKKIATGLLLGPVEGAPEPAGDQPAAKAAPLGSYQGVKARLGELLDQEKP